VIVVALTVVPALIAAGLAWTARLVHVGNLDALALAVKTATPEPLSPLDWPELRVRAVIGQPDRPSVVLLHVEWPARQQQATMLVAIDGDTAGPWRLLPRWCAERASIAATRRGGTGLELRRRQSLERVRGYLLAEDGPARCR
jgi:hypothetical protein